MSWEPTNEDWCKIDKAVKHFEQEESKKFTLAEIKCINNVFVMQNFSVCDNGGKDARMFKKVFAKVKSIIEGEEKKMSREFQNAENKIARAARDSGIRKFMVDEKFFKYLIKNCVRDEKRRAEETGKFNLRFNGMTVEVFIK